MSDTGDRVDALSRWFKAGPRNLNFFYLKHFR